MKPTRLIDLGILLVFAAAAAWLLVRVAYGELPHIPLYAGASLYPVTVIELVAAFMIRARVRDAELGDGRRQLHPITVARAAALAKASAIVGAASAGVWLGVGLWLLPQLSRVSSAMADSPGTLVGFVAGLALLGAALWLEHCCKTPGEPPADASSA